MGFFDWFRKDNLDEEMVVRKNTPNDKIIIDDEVSEVLNEATVAELEDFIGKLKRLGKDRKELYDIMQEMSKDSIVGSAMELLSDDATQSDNIRDVEFWAEPEGESDDEAANYVNEFFKDSKLYDKYWTIIYAMVRDGSVFLKTYHSEIAKEESKGAKSDEFTGDLNKDLVAKKGYIFEIVDDPEKVYDMEYLGDTVGFGVESEDKFMVTPIEDYIHVINDRRGHREKKTITLKKEGKEIKHDYKIRYGSPAFETAIQAWQLLDLIELLVLYLRFRRADYFRLVAVEVGAAGRKEVVKILREVKSKFNTQQTMDKTKEQFKGIKKPLPKGENVYLAVKNGKGGVSIEEHGGNVDVKELADLDYFRNKLFAALRIPKAYLGFEETQPGGLGNLSLTRMDIRYARMVKTISKAGIRGMQDIAEFHCKEMDREDYIGRFKVVGTKIMSAEESDRADELMSNISLGQALLDFLDGKEGVKMKELTEFVVDNILGLADAGDFFEKEEGKNENGSK